MSGRVFTITVKQFHVDVDGDLCVGEVIGQGLVVPPPVIDFDDPADAEEVDEAIREIVQELLCSLGLCDCAVQTNM